MPCWTHGGSPRQAAPTSARKAVEVTLWTSYTLLCAPRSAFITRGSRGPANFTMALWKQATSCRASLGHLPDGVGCLLLPALQSTHVPAQLTRPLEGPFLCPLPGLAATSAAHSCLSGPHSPTALWADTPTHAGPTYDGS